MFYNYYINSPIFRTYAILLFATLVCSCCLASYSLVVLHVLLLFLFLIPSTTYRRQLSFSLPLSPLSLSLSRCLSVCLAAPRCAFIAILLHSVFLNFKENLYFDRSPFSIIVDGAWGSWSEWNRCSVSCGAGFKNRTRKCDYPAPLGDGKDCDGIATQEMPCIMPICSSKYELLFWVSVSFTFVYCIRILKVSRMFL